MANDARIRQNNIQGTLSSTLTAAATTMVSAALANLQAVTSTQHAVIVLDPGRANGAPELVRVTAHTAASTKATVVRGAEGTAARTHPTPLEAWLHAPTNYDYNQVKTSTSRPSANIFAGQTIWERDKTLFRIFDGSTWRPVDNPRLLNVTNAVVGAAPAVDGITQFRMQTGTSVVTPASSGVKIVYPTAFGTGVISTIANMGDGSTRLTVLQVQSLATSTKFTVKVWSSTGILKSGSVRVNWIAIGW